SSHTRLHLAHAPSAQEVPTTMAQATEGTAAHAIAEPDIERYDAAVLEPPLAQRWYEEGTYTLPADHDGEPYYALTMFPYPSGDLHMGHGEIFTIHDALVRHLRMTGRAVLNPFGWDAFGLP